VQKRKRTAVAKPKTPVATAPVKIPLAATTLEKKDVDQGWWEIR